jgi:ribosome-associated protein
MPASLLEPAITPETETATDAPAIKRGEATSLQLALAAARIAAENRGENITVLDLREVTPVFDYFVIATGTNRRQLHAISEEIDHYLEDDLGEPRMGIEGYVESRWILLDYGSIVVHLFDAEMRAFYALEDLWNDAVKVPLPSDPAPEA